MMRKRRGKSKTIEISSLIDILFILLIFLMLSVRFTESNTLFEYNLPKAEAQVVGDIEKEIRISISKSGEHFINGQKIEKTKIARWIGEEQIKNPKALIVLEIDTDAKFGDFFDLTNALKSISIQNIQIATKR